VGLSFLVLAGVWVANRLVGSPRTLDLVIGASYLCLAVAHLVLGRRQTARLARAEALNRAVVAREAAARRAPDRAP